MEAHEVHALNKENPVGDFWKLFFVIKGKIYKVFWVKAKGEGAFIISVVVCFKAIAN
jgi:hypothetical protein